MSNLQAPAADRLWQRFGEMFGARFFESFGPRPSQSWADAVKDLRNDQVKAALSRIRNSGSPHPPSLPEFVALAKNVRALEFVKPTPDPFDAYHGFGQRCLMSFLRQNDVDDFQLQKLVAMKNHIVDQYRTTGEGEPSEWRDVLLAALSKEIA